MITRGMVSTLLLIVLYLVKDFASAEIHFKKGAPHVTLSNNAKLSGSLDYSREGRPFSSFIGVPFGKIPGRFEAAVPAPPWEGTLEAVKQGEMCVQGWPGKVMTLGSEESCLNLNVYVPMNNTGEEGGFPVMLWVHGGGFSGGMGIAYGPNYFMDEDVIQITFNYRLGVFGFLSTGDEVISGNYGMKDQVLVLKWVKEHIRNFGGNPERVTVFGESAGGGSVSHLVLSPTTEGLFQQAIAQSGSALALWAFNPNPRATAVKLATHLKCPTEAADPSEISSEEIKTCLTGLSAEDLNNGVSTFAKRWPPVALSLDFVPVKEPKSSPSPFLTESPWSILVDKALPLKKIPFIIGTTEDEGIALYSGYILQDQKLIDELDSNWEDLIITSTLLEKFVKPTEHATVAKKIRDFYFGDKAVSLETRTNLTNMYSDIWFVYGVWKAAVQTAMKGEEHPTYLYQYAYHGPVCAMKLFGFAMAEEETKMVGHGDDFTLQFDLDKIMPGIPKFIEKDSDHERFSKKFIKQWVDFAVRGEPSSKIVYAGCPLPMCDSTEGEWKPLPKIEVEGRVPLRWYKIDAELGYFDEGQLGERVRFWDELLEDHMLPALRGEYSIFKGNQKTEL